MKYNLTTKPMERRAFCVVKLNKCQTLRVNDNIYDFDSVFLEIPVKNCIMGMLLTCPIDWQGQLF